MEGLCCYDKKYQTKNIKQRKLLNLTNETREKEKLRRFVPPKVIDAASEGHP